MKGKMKGPTRLYDCLIIFEKVSSNNNLAFAAENLTSTRLTGWIYYKMFLLLRNNLLLELFRIAISVRVDKFH